MGLSIKSVVKLTAISTLISISFAANATVYTVNYTGKVDSTNLYGSAPLPEGISIGSIVKGSFSFNTQDADPNPQYVYGSCSGICGGDSVDAFFTYQDNLIQNVEISGHSWSANLGKVSLGDNFFIPGQELRTVGVDSSIAIYDDPLISFAISSTNNPLFSDINSISEGIQFGNADTGFGIIRNNDFYISFSVDLPLQSSVSSVPVPGAIWLFGSTLVGFIGMSRRNKS